MIVVRVESDYNVTEGGSREVCAVVVSGTLERDAVVTLSTEDGTAIGELPCIVHYNNNFIILSGYYLNTICI